MFGIYTRIRSSFDRGEASLLQVRQQAYGYFSLVLKWRSRFRLLCVSVVRFNRKLVLTPYLDHFGVVKAFVQANLLPRVVTGTSAGGLVAAFACTRTDSELKRLLVPELADKITACEDPFGVWMKRFLTTGARFDSVAWARKVRWSHESKGCQINGTLRE